ncbi:hypothetical protein Nmel_017177, partial [Mimus melanotis]
SAVSEWRWQPVNPSPERPSNNIKHARAPGAGLINSGGPIFLHIALQRIFGQVGKDIKSNNKNKKGKKKLWRKIVPGKPHRNLLSSFIRGTNMMMMKEDCN